MEIRKLYAADAEKYWTLRLEAFQTFPEAFATSYEEAIARENPIQQAADGLEAVGSCTFGAFVDGELIGIVTLVQEMREKQRHRADIFGMFVKASHQGSGGGKALMSEAINYARNLKGIEKVNLSVVANNEGAKKLYSNLGFKVFGYEEKALKVGDVYLDEEHMVLFI
ncbi:GNAT family N-acetyltransferase [Peribacillus loiseleuriae]|uniref:Acetyltransferase n=1 Tax=Peribacillus loiseleuriae TaxID=1679170 RepID=A0A0K9GXI2_9BACI|nr:GNAT family N-acetyltransferase [Peribacillus loiseleuriae]KMY51358.1 acetyltransferase [Peribacillus loiseleuriae]